MFFLLLTVKQFRLNKLLDVLLVNLQKLEGPSIVAREDSLHNLI